MICVSYAMYMCGILMTPPDLRLMHQLGHRLLLLSEHESIMLQVPARQFVAPTSTEKGLEMHGNATFKSSSHGFRVSSGLETPRKRIVEQDSLGPHEVLATIIRTGLVAKESLREPRTTPRLTDNLRRRGGLSGSRAKRFRSVSQSRKLTYGILWPTGRLRRRHRRPRAPRPWPARPSPAWAGARGARGTRGKASPARSKPRTPLNKSFHPKGYQT